MSKNHKSCVDNEYDIFGRGAPVKPAEDSGWKFHTVKT